MKGRPLFPFAIIAIAGILLMLVLSFQGLLASQADEGEAEEEIVIEDPIAAGEELVQRSCISCHGQDLQGLASNPAINALEGKFTEEEIVQIIFGQYEGVSMPAMSNLQQVEAEAIATYLISISE
ncbi:cytochrome C551 [Alkalihalophilus pseudofirmus]|uniref:c-type cytochrome n=1 Tax=Alkalihalobacterium alkalinitrilicum TaxID=427920 RepID=UPI00094C2567|nr:cytochrome c [Alkalihalobacterium alkalinitrilicum]OLO38905.1 cytochrome C551 [Alkalihalophilus pseudofirmus]